MAAVAGLRESGAIPPCSKHPPRALLLACPECCAAYAYREALRTAEHWREKYRTEHAARVALEKEMGR